MQLIIGDSPEETGKLAGDAAAALIQAAIEKNGTAHIILATGTSQFASINQLVNNTGIDWSKVVMFHLDEYIGLPETAPASFRKYLKERFLSRISSVKAAYLIDGEAPGEQECERLNQLIVQYPIDVALVGIGENGHLAFNDPPADFETEKPYIVVNLDEPCRQQQLGEGWFHTLEEVPLRAISMSVKQILRSKSIICSVPGSRKAVAVKNSVEQAVSNQYPASILQTHEDCTLYLDKDSAVLIGH